MFCHKCGSNSPNIAEYCYKCGAKLATENEWPQSYSNDSTFTRPVRNKRTLIVLVAVFVALIFLVAVISMYSSNSGRRTTSVNTVEYLSITATELQNLYDDNTMMFDRDIKGKNVAVTGVVSDITRTTVKLRVKNNIFYDETITCEISQSSISYIADNFRVGNTATLYGKVSVPTASSSVLDGFVIADCSARIPGNAKVVDLTDSSISGIGQLNGSYSDALGLSVYTFRNNKVTVEMFGISLGEGEYVIDGSNMKISGIDLFGTGVKTEVTTYSYRQSGNTIYLDGTAYTKE